MRESKAECLSNAKTFESKMTHLFSWGMFGSGNELELEPFWTWGLCRAPYVMWPAVSVHGRVLSHPGAVPCSNPKTWLIMNVRSRGTVGSHLMNY